VTANIVINIDDAETTDLMTNIRSIVLGINGLESVLKPMIIAIRIAKTAPLKTPNRNTESLTPRNSGNLAGTSFCSVIAHTYILAII
jgi:hypothetical protein